MRFDIDLYTTDVGMVQLLIYTTDVGMIQLLIELKLIMANRWLSKMTASFEFDFAVP